VPPYCIYDSLRLKLPEAKYLLRLRFICTRDFTSPPSSYHSQLSDPAPNILGKVFEQEKVRAQRSTVSEKVSPRVNTEYSKKGGYRDSIPCQVFSNPSAEDIGHFRLALEQNFVPPTFFDNLSRPLPRSLGSYSEYCQSAP